MKHFLGAALMIGVLAGCLGPKDEAPEEDDCGAAHMQPLIGTPVVAQDFTTSAAALRLLPPGAMMTMDHRPDRLNIEHDANGVITRIWCG
ncbi:I78 family peptidase inhibitor [Roseovarius sp.]|uniref:I78 family peptidase inhibitor n=1 Tax=Roseovarius sp. TaxID=1486281 RepID=UPI003A987F10